MTEHIAKKCNIPKKIKLSLSKKNVTEVISEQINTSTPRRFKNFIVWLSEKLAKLEDIPDMIIKLPPIHCAISNGKPFVIFSNSIS